MKSATNEEDDNASVVKGDNEKSMQNVRKQKLFLINLLKG